jgi:succinate dehydrogenase / fumarate reductase, cytochrome b subunit
MGLKRDVSLSAGLRYKGPAGYLTYILHRIGGLGMGIFITVHILASYVGGGFGGLLNGIYQNWAFQIFIFFCVLFHAINGLRITILDLWPKLLDFQTEAIWIEWAVFIPLFGISVFIILNTAFGG